MAKFCSPFCSFPRDGQNLEEAVYWFEKAAASGLPQAMLNLGKMLEQVSG